MSTEFVAPVFDDYNTMSGVAVEVVVENAPVAEEPAPETATPETVTPAPVEAAADEGYEGYEGYVYPLTSEPFTRQELARWIAGLEAHTAAHTAAHSVTTYDEWSHYATSLMSHAMNIMGLDGSSIARQLLRGIWMLRSIHTQTCETLADTTRQLEELTEDWDDLQKRIKGHNDDLESAASAVEEVGRAITDLRASFHDTTPNDAMNELDQYANDLERIIERDWPENL